MKKITLLLLTLFTFTTGKAQWTTDTAVNTPVATTINNDTKSIGTNDGKTYVVFWKSVGAPTNFELRMQLLDANGYPQFGPEGMLVSNTIPMSTSTSFWRLSIDTNNNLYIGVTGTGSGTPSIAFKIDTAGNMLWGANGINLGTGYLTTILPLSTGEVMISYWPGTKTKLQKFTSNGTPIWPAAIDLVSSNATSATMIGDLYEMANHDVVAVFHRRLTSFGVGSNLFAQRYNYNDGTTVWAAPVQLSDKNTVYNTYYSGTQDGDVVYYGYTGTTGTGSHFDAYVTKINVDGTLPWGLNGLDFDTNVSHTYYEKDVMIATTPGSSYLWALARYTPSSQDLQGEFVQKFDKHLGVRLFTDDAKQVFPVDNFYKTQVNFNSPPNLILVNDAPLFLIKSGFDNGATPTSLHITQLNNNGDFLWPEQTFPIATFSANKGRISLMKPVNNQVVAVFSEAKVASEPRIYAQSFTNATLPAESFQTTENTISVYPNPSNGIFNIKSDSSINSIKVVDMLGKEIYSNNNVNNLESTIDGTNWAKGIYIITIQTKTITFKSFKIISE